MIKVVFYMKEGRMCGFKSSGHADYADQGEDIVCAGVSALVINCVNSLEKLTDDRADVKQTDDGYVSCMIQEPVSSEGELLLQSLHLGITHIAEDYKRYVKVVVKSSSQ